MSDEIGPWGRRDGADQVQPAATVSRWRLYAWIGVVAALVAGVVALAWAFPGAMQVDTDWGWVARGVGMAALVSMALLVPGRLRWRQGARDAIVWGLVLGLLVLGFTYRDELSGVVQRVRAELTSTYPVASGAHELVVSEAEGGGFFVMGQVNGRPVRFLVDTGASDTVLSPADAARLRLDPAKLRYERPSETANGVGFGAPFTADSLTVGAIRLTGVAMQVNQAPMSQSLLGMSFLKRLESFQVRGHKLYLRYKG